MNRISVIFFISISLLWSNSQSHQLELNELYLVPKIPRAVEDYAKNKLKPIKDERIRALNLSYIFGINSKLSKTDRKLHQILNLKHLFSPSGLHVSSILFVFLWMVRKKWKYAYFFWSLSILGLFGLSLKLPGYFPLKRTLGFHLLNVINEYCLKKKKLGLSAFQIFMALMTIDFSFGSFQESPLSFTYSFLFWGIILSERHFTHRIFYLGLGQLLVCHFSHFEINPFSIFTNIILSPLFSLFFPLIFFSVIFELNLLTTYLTTFYLKTLEFFSKSISLIPSLMVEDIYIYLLIMILIYKELKLPKTFILLLLICSTPISVDRLEMNKDFKKRYITKTKKPPEGGFSFKLKTN